MARIAAVVVFALTACVAQGPRTPPLAREQLLSSDALFRASTAIEVTPLEEIFALDDEMRAFVAAEIDRFVNPEVKLRRLIAGLEARGLFAADNYERTTRTARETYYAQRGNCLSVTILFVMLAREAGLEAEFQMVNVPPVWSNDSGQVILATHINALVAAGREYHVDFNEVRQRGNYATHEVSDTYAAALFYNNVGAEALIDEDYATSFAHLTAAARTFADMPGPWANLGLLYARHGLYEHAESAYLEGLGADRRDHTSLSNLVVLHTTLGNTELSNLYQERIERYRRINPYYHYLLAQRAYEQAELDDTMAQLARAIRLKDDEHLFYALLGHTQQALGRVAEARNSFVEARRHARYEDIRQHYETQIAALANSQD